MTNSARFNLEGKRIWVAGHRGMVGSALKRRLGRENCEILTVDRGAVDLRRQAETENWIAEAKPSAIFVAAATVGGILANDRHPVDFLYDNLMIEANILEAAHRTGVEKLVLLGSSCVYPKLALQPMSEDALLTGPLEPTNQWYAVAKIAGIKLARAYRRQHGRDFIAAMPANLYGPQDNFDLNSGHALAALMRKAHEAKERGEAKLVVWGTGAAKREFLHVDDCAEALVFLLQAYSGEPHINIGSGEEVTIGELAGLICEIVGLDADIVHDTTKPEGPPRKVVDSERLRSLGWRPRIALRDGIAETYRWYRENCT
jgi:GDP-L-fucose synthase